MFAIEYINPRKLVGVDEADQDWTRLIARYDSELAARAMREHYELCDYGCVYRIVELDAEPANDTEEATP